MYILRNNQELDAGSSGIQKARKTEQNKWKEES